MDKVLCIKGGRGIEIDKEYILMGKFFDQEYGEIYHVKLSDRRSGQYPADHFSSKT